MEVLRRCPLAIAQRLVHCAIAVSNAVLGQSHKDNGRCTAVEQQLEAKEVQLSQPSSTSPDLFWANLKVQLHFPPLDLLIFWSRLEPCWLLLWRLYFIPRVQELYQSSVAVWESRWPSWAVRPNEPSGFRGRKEILNYAHAQVSPCP